jgi:hypothetical protein
MPKSLRRLLATIFLAASPWALAAPPRIWGVTVDRPGPVEPLVEAVEALPRRMMVRVVLDDGVPPATYGPLILHLAGKAELMLELEDSIAMKAMGLAAMEAKTRAYLDAFGDQVAVWEVGNEINGDWLGPDQEVAAKVAAAFDLVTARGGRTALTLHYGGGDPLSGMVHWSKAYLPTRMLQRLDYVFVSYYPEDQEVAVKPDWNKVFRRLGELFPRSLLGIGECGSRPGMASPERLREAYGLQVRHPRFVGGYFWWNFATDMVPRTLPGWEMLRQELALRR